MYFRKYGHRIIPTRVGTSIHGLELWKGPRDHPHACGDKNHVALVYRRRFGSSPRVWGQGLHSLQMTKLCRIIPTRVGTSWLCRGVPLDSEDHPHACGDKRNRQSENPGLKGSSPRVWGQVGSIQICPVPNRIIPTRVGTSFRCFV